MDLIKCDRFRAKISAETCRVRKEKASSPKAQDYVNKSNYSFLQCLDCDLDSKKRVEVDVGKIDTGQQEPVCSGCGKKASEVNKFNAKAKICNSCWQKEYRLKQGPRVRGRKINKEDYTPPPKTVPSCVSCGVKCTDAETFDIKAGLCGECKAELPTFPVAPKMAQGLKHDAHKLRYDLVPPEALEEIVKVLTFGATKYTDRNWEKGINYGRVYGALMRHMQAFWRGEDMDSESGLSHLSHAGCCLFFLLTYARRTMKELDDRPSSRPAPLLDGELDSNHQKKQA